MRVHNLKSGHSAKVVKRQAQGLKKMIGKNKTQLTVLGSILAVLTASFFYGWYIDPSTPLGGRGWADQTLYTTVAHIFAQGELPSPGQLHYAVGYPLMGALGVLLGVNAFVPISLSLLLASATFVFLAVKQLMGLKWATLCVALLFIWDGVGATFNSASELFVIPWNNQVLFFAFAFFFWVLSTQMKRNRRTYWFIGVMGLVAGLAFLTREEAIIFVAPLLATALYFLGATWKQWLFAFIIFLACYIPQAVVKEVVLGSVGESGGTRSYALVVSQYLSPERLVRNIHDTIIVNNQPDDIPGSRQSLFEGAPWLWLSVPGIFLLLISKRVPLPVKFFILISIALLVFYLSGKNMSLEKLKFHCLRYISPAFIMLTFASIFFIRGLYRFISIRLRHYQTRSRNIAETVHKNIGGDSQVWQIVEAVPILVPVVLAGFSIVAMIFLLLGRFEAYYIWPLGLAVASFMGLLTYRLVRFDSQYTLGSRFERRLISLFLVIAMIMWVGVNLPLTSEHVLTDRDPAIYAVTGAWLVENGSLLIEKPVIGENIVGISSTSGGFGSSADDNSLLFAQGAHLLPALLGLVGKIVGNTQMYHVSVVFGGTALLAIFAFARLLVKPRWAFAAAATMALSLPLLYFSRDTYTEPLALTFIFGGMSLAVIAARLENSILWLMAGIVLGASALVRIDSYFVIALSIIPLAVYLINRPRREQKTSIIHSVLYLVGVGLVSLLGLLDVRHLSSGYFFSEWSKLLPELLFVVFSVATVAVIVIFNRYNKVKLFSKLNISKVNAMRISWMIALVWIILATRPFWLNLGDGKLSYAYNPTTVNWLIWYIGPLAVILGVVGLCLIIFLIVRSRNRQERYVLALFFTVVMGMALLYLIRPSITPDQIWASRRLLPVVMPGMVIAAAYTLYLLYEARPVGLSKYLGIDYKILASVIATGMVLSPLLISIPYVDKDFLVQRDYIEKTCNHLSNGDTVLWVGQASPRMVMPTRVFCGTDSVVGTATDLGISERQLLPHSTVLSQYAMQAEEMNKRPVVGLFGRDLPETGPAYPWLTPVSVSSITNIVSTIDRPPRLIESKDESIYLGVVQADGTIEPIER